MPEQGAIRERAIRTLSHAELRWTVRQDERLAEGLLNGRFGQSFRQRRAADSEALQRIRNQSYISALALFGAGMTSGLFGPAAAYNPTLLLQGVGASMTKSAEFHRALLEQINQELGPETAARDQIVQVEVAGTVRQINAASRQDLQKQLLQLYQERFGSQQ